MLSALIALILHRLYGHEGQPLTIVIPSCLGMFLFVLYVALSSAAYGEKAHAEMDAYSSYMAEVEKKLGSEGFVIGSKKPHLRPGYESHITLTYENKDYACTVVTPADATRNVEFACSESNLSLEVIQENN